MSRLWFGLPIIAMCLGLSQAAQAMPILTFDQDQYVVNEGESFDVQVVLDADSATSALEALDNGLFSMAFEVTFDGFGLQVQDTGKISLPTDLNDDGTGRLPIHQVGNGFARVRGALSTQASDVYRNPLLATLTFNALTQGQYDLQLGILRSGPNDQVFIDGLGNVLDNSLGLGSATVTVVVPEPASVAVLGIVGSLAVFGRRWGWCIG